MITSPHIAALFPKLDTVKLELSYPVSSVVSAGIGLGSLVLQDKFMSSTDSFSQAIVLADPIRFDLLSYLPSIAGIISRNEDPSSHIAIVCRARGLPIVNVDESFFTEISSKTQGAISQCAISTFAKTISFGAFTLDRSQYIYNRSVILNKLHGKLPFSLTSNADTADDVALAVACGFKKFWPRSETLLYSPEVLAAFRTLLINPTIEFSDNFKRLHQSSIVDLLLATKGHRLVFRLLDPPAHEFLPQLDDNNTINQLSKQALLSSDVVKKILSELREDNPMIGHRGVRLLMTHPLLLKAQVCALCDAWLSLSDAEKPPFVEIFVPFVITALELKIIKHRIFEIIRCDTTLPQSKIKFGTMIETPAIMDYPHEVAPMVDFVSYGTNDLTATHYALSRGNCYRAFLNAYINDGLIDTDPFCEFTPHLINKIITFSDALREKNPSIEIDTCGEQSLGRNIWSAVRANAFTSISIGVENLPVMLDNMYTEGYLNEQYESTI